MELTSDGFRFTDEEVQIDAEFKALNFSDLEVVTTLGMGGFGRVELVRVLFVCCLLFLATKICPVCVHVQL